MLRWQYSSIWSRFHTIAIKIPVDLFAEVYKLILEFIWKYMEQRIAKAILKKFPDFETYHETTAFKIVWYSSKNQWSRSERLPLNTVLIDFLFFALRCQDKFCWVTWISMCKRIQLDSYLTQHTKISSKWITGLNVTSTTIKAIEELIFITLN